MEAEGRGCLGEKSGTGRRASLVQFLVHSQARYPKLVPPADLLLLSLPTPCPTTSARERGAAPSNPTGQQLAKQLASPQPNTGQDLDCQAPGVPVWLAEFSPSQVSPVHISGQPQVRHSNPGGNEPWAQKPLPPPLPLAQAHSSQAAPRRQPTLPPVSHLTSDSSRPGTVGRPMSGRQWPLTPPLRLGTGQQLATPVNEVRRSEQVARAVAACASG